MSIISLSHLTKTYTTYVKQPGVLNAVKSMFSRESVLKTAVDDVSFDVEEGELVGFLGPNGAGKTTTLKMLSGILWPSSGEAHVMGYVPWERKRDYQREIALVTGQKNQLWWELPAMDSFLLQKDIYEVSDRAFRSRMDMLVDGLDLAQVISTPVKRLSLGERMKCELVNALLHNPRVLFLDEPTIGLDVVSQRTVHHFLKQWNREQKTTILLTSHSMSDVEALCERLLVIDHGELSYQGTLSELKRTMGDAKLVRVQTDTAATRREVEAIAPMASYTPHEVVYRVERGDVARVVADITRLFAAPDISVEDLSAEEVIYQLFSKNAGVSQARRILHDGASRSREVTKDRVGRTTKPQGGGQKARSTGRTTR